MPGPVSIPTFALENVCFRRRSRSIASINGIKPSIAKRTLLTVPVSAPDDRHFDGVVEDVGKAVVEVKLASIETPPINPSCSNNKLVVIMVHAVDNPIGGDAYFTVFPEMISDKQSTTNWPNFSSV